MKGFFLANGIEAVMLPDISDNLDGVTASTYERLKGGGVSIGEIASMAGARLTVEFSETIDEKLSPGQYLLENFGVPLLRLPLPIGLENIERFYAAFDVKVDEAEKGRYLDAMVDNHKYAARARAAVYGEPDFVAAVSALCFENGIVPSVIATGSVCPEISKLQAPALECAGNAFATAPKVMDDADFDDIGRACEETGANLMIGSSDGRRVAKELDVDVIRCAFPIHDRVGGQRVRTLGFDGSLWLLDSVANAMLSRTAKSYREDLYEAYHG